MTIDKYYQRRKRALNMVWTASADYDIDPPYLFYRRNDEPALYPNTILGLGYRCLDRETVGPFLEGMEVGRDPDKFRALALILLEEAVYRRSLAERPTLEALRLTYAREHLREYRSPDRYPELGWERQEMIRCRKITGEPLTGFASREIKLAEELEQAAALPEREMVAEAKAIFFRYYYYKFTRALKSETTDFVGAGMFIVLAGRLMGLRMHSSTGVGVERGGHGEGGPPTAGEKVLAFWKHLVSQTTRQEDYDFILQTFGPCMYNEEEIAAIEERWCRDYHRRCRLWYTDGMVVDPSLGQEVARQAARNRGYYMAEQRAYERSIRHITDHLKHALEEQLEPDVVHQHSGRLDAGQVYRIRAMHDLKVFRREVSFPDPDFTVDLMLDASSSRHEEQEAIAVQAYILTRSLLNLEIPVQVTSYRSLRGFTVLQKLKGYEETASAEGVFRYFCMGNNRDGLAIRAMHPLMDADRMEKKKRIMLVLTDAVPADTEKAYISGRILQSEDYDTDLAVNDTRDAVQQMKREGVKVAAIFWGKRHAVPNLKQIYGDRYVSIHHIRQLPDAVIGLLLRILAALRDSEFAD